ncbi:hypothetical protein GF420_07520, partial [candidate division GN15 bacterium]|nr:hypothetical protein [candidate division GN15 bacterium]
MQEIGFICNLHDDLHHAPPGHPESARRLQPTVNLLTSDSPPVSLTAIELRSFGEEPIYAVHDRTFLDQLKSFAEHGGGQY